MSRARLSVCRTCFWVVVREDLRQRTGRAGSPLLARAVHGRAQGRHLRPSLHALQLLPHPSNAPRHSRDGGRDCRSRLVTGRGCCITGVIPCLSNRAIATPRRVSKSSTEHAFLSASLNPGCSIRKAISDITKHCLSSEGTVGCGIEPMLRTLTAFH